MPERIGLSTSFPTIAVFRVINVRVISLWSMDNGDGSSLEN